jgi:hypothetical protein
MTNPLVHALIFLAAVLIPGGLLVYFAWRAISLKRVLNHAAQNPGSENIPDTLSPTPDEAQSAFREMFPKDSPVCGHARSKRVRLDRVHAFRHRKFKN